MTRAPLILSAILIAAMIGVSIYGWSAIPADTMIARHWSLSGEADGYSPRDHVLIGLPLLGMAFTALFLLIPKIDPRTEHVRQSRGLLHVGWLGTLGLLLVVHYSVIAGAIKGGDSQPMPGLTLYGLCLLIVLMGNYTAKSRSNFFLGVRTPWTLSSEHAWAVANRTAGWLFVLTGLAAAAAGTLLDPSYGYKVFLAGVLSAALISVVVSYFAWRADPERRNA